ncbi:hypothetical protein, partial [Mesorhizobium sp. M1A.F.Ca.IN.022.04.1.1]|uniref:hypothetical protein n=1 Tax=Mesorhizobium sp. M1A.F.Ca.IN.022.04.1.1 TaxID=2496773 RepID=UPI0019D1D18C
LENSSFLRSRFMIPPRRLSGRRCLSSADERRGGIMNRLRRKLEFSRARRFRRALFCPANSCIGRRKLSLADSAKIKDKFPLGQFAGPRLT